MPDLVSAFAALAPAADAILGDALAPYALFIQQNRMIGTIAIDVPIRELHSDTFVISQNPTQAGYAVADGYFASPARLEMTCGFSDCTAGYQGYSQQCYEAFLALAATKKTFSVSTGKRYYDNLLIENVDVRTDQTSEYALDITVRLQEFIIATTSGGTAGPQGAASDQANPASTGTTVDSGTQSTLPYFASGQTPAGYTPGATTGTGVGAAGIGGSPFNLSGGAR